MDLVDYYNSWDENMKKPKAANALDTQLPTRVLGMSTGFLRLCYGIVRTIQCNHRCTHT